MLFRSRKNAHIVGILRIIDPELAQRLEVAFDLYSRDIEDVAEIIKRVILSHSVGILNIATGEVVSFRDIAEQVVKLSSYKSQIKCNPRSGPMPHNGYRPFNVTATHKAFPDFYYTTLEEGLLKMSIGEGCHL